MQSNESPQSKIRQFLSTRQSGEFTFERLYNVAGEYDQLDIAEALAALVHEGTLKQFVRVESPDDKGGIGDFDTMLDVPDEMEDYRTGTDLVVTPEHLRVMYRIAG
jgi:hypothetical protein